MTIINTDYSTRDLQEEEIAALEDIDNKLANPLTVSLPTGAATEATLASLNSKVTAVNTGAVTVSSSALPTGASTSANQTTGNNSLSSIDTKTPSLGQALAASSVPVVLTAAQITTLTPPAAISGFSTEATLASLNGKVTAVNTGAVVVSSSALPSGASTSALQSSGNASLTSIDGKTPALGQALAAASVPVVLTASQLTTLTPPAAITGFATETTLSTLNNKFAGAAVLADTTSNPTLSSIAVLNFALNGSGSWDRIRAGITSVTSAFSGYTNQIPVAQYLSSVGTLTNGQASPLMLDVNKNLRVADAPATAILTTIDVDTGNIATSTSSIDGKIPSTAALADAVANPTISALSAYNMVFDGSTWNRQKAGITSVAANIGGMINVLPMGRYNGTSAPSLSTGDGSILQMDNTGNLKIVSSGSNTLFKNAGANTTLNVKASSGTVFSVSCRNINAAARYIQLWNTSTTAGTGTLLFEYMIPTNTTVNTGTDFFTEAGTVFSSGIAFGFSTTSGTYTAGTATDHFTMVVYR